MPSEFYGCLVFQAGVRADCVVVWTPVLDDDCCLASRAKPFNAQASSRNLPLKLSSAPFCHGFPGSIRAT